MQRLGTKLNTLRNAKDISLDEIAEKCMLSVDQIKSVESGEIIPSLSVLIKICHALEVPIGTLLDGIEPQGVAVTREGERPEAVNLSSGVQHKQDSHLEFYSMAPTRNNRNMEPFLIFINRINKQEELSSHEGEEFVYVIKGEIELTHGDSVTIIKEGDSAYYDSIVPHKVRSISEKSKVLAVVYTPL